MSASTGFMLALTTTYQPHICSALNRHHFRRGSTLKRIAPEIQQSQHCPHHSAIYSAPKIAHQRHYRSTKIWSMPDTFNPGSGDFGRDQGGDAGMQNNESCNEAHTTDQYVRDTSYEALNPQPTKHGASYNAALQQSNHPSHLPGAANHSCGDHGTAYDRDARTYNGGRCGADQTTPQRTYVTDEKASEIESCGEPGSSSHVLSKYPPKDVGRDDVTIAIITESDRTSDLTGGHPPSSPQQPPSGASQVSEAIATGQAESERQRSEFVSKADGDVTWQWRKEMLQRMVSFMLPALTIPMADPLMSIVDTVCIGQFSGTTQLAALGPANVVFMLALYVFFPLQVATVRIVGAYIAEERVEDAQNVLRSVLLIAAGFGLFMAGVFEMFADPILHLMGAQASLIPLSSEYLRIRAVAQPAVLFVMVAQSALLAQRDSLAPALVVVVMAAANAAGNGIFVAGLGMGMVGAAMTTVVTQYAGAVGMIWALSRRGKLRPGVRRPRLSELRLFMQTLGPLGIVSVCKNLTQLLIQSTAAALPTLQLAAHQATISLWMFCVMLSVPIEQAAYSFLPTTKTRPQMIAVAQMLLVIALVCGVCSGGVAAALIAHLPSLFTQDTAVWALLRPLQMQVLFSLLLAVVDISTGGMLVVRGHLWYLAGSTCVTLAAIAAAIHVLKSAGSGLSALWWVQVLFYGVRCLQNTTRLIFSVWGSNKAGPVEDDAGTGSVTAT